MKLKDMLPSGDQIKLVQGVEKNLLRRKQTGNISLIVALVWGIIQILLSFETKYIHHLGRFVSHFISGQWGELIGDKGVNIYDITGTLILILAFGTFFLYRMTSFRLKEAEEPFRYTFWIDEFKRVDKTQNTQFLLRDDDKFFLLHHDLMERLNQRIKRFSILDDASSLSEEEKNELISHIHICGDYAIRMDKDGDWVIHLIPRIRIGPSDRPSTLAYPIIFNVATKTQKEKNLDPSLYNQIVERTYSSIATEIYRQIKSDIKEKLILFPTGYQQAVALFYEAKDFERSNTIDSYDCAIELYKEAKRYFDISNIKWISRIFLRLPLLWRMERKFLHMYSRTLIGYSRCIIYRRVISALSGRSKNPLFEIRTHLEQAIDWLEKLNKQLWKTHIRQLFAFPNTITSQDSKTVRSDKKRLYALMAFLNYPKDSILRRSESLFYKLNESLFDAYVVAALAYYHLGAIKKAEENLKNAKAVAPDLSVENPLYLLAAAEIEPDLDKEILLFKKTTELAPSFEIAQYKLAHYSERRFRVQNELIKTRAESVIKEYDEVLKINPGNIAAYAAQGYILWLLGDNEKAKKKFKEGCNIKAAVRQTFIGELNYGLARIAAEEARFNRSYDLFTNAISADPEVGAYSPTITSFVMATYYDYIGSAMLEGRYKSYKEHTIKKIIYLKNKIEKLLKENTKEKVLDKDKEELTLRTLEVVHSYVLNDYGNACLNYFHRFGDNEKLINAIDSFEKATKVHKDNAIACYNLHNAYSWSGEKSEKIVETIEKAGNLAPAWPFISIVSAQSLLRSGNEEIKKISEDINKDAEKIETLINKLKNKEVLYEKLEDKGMASLTKPEKERENFTAQLGRLGINKIYRDKPEESISEIHKTQEEIKELRESVSKANDKVNKLVTEALKIVFEKVDEFVNRTKLSSMFKGLKLDVDGRGINRLRLKDIQIDRLDEIDVEALKIWANVLSKNYREEKAFRAARKLTEYIVSTFYPDNFDLNLILYEMYNRKFDDYRIKQIIEGNDTDTKKKTDSIQEYKKKREECNRKKEEYVEIIRPTIENWLKQDPVFYAALAKTDLFFKIEEIEKFYRKACDVEPNIALYHARRGDYLRALNNLEDAKSEYRKAVKLAPNNADYLNMLGNIYFEMGDMDEYEKSTKYYNEAIQKKKDQKEIDTHLAVFYANLGGAYYELKKWKQAEKSYAEAIKIEPNKADYNYKLGMIYQERKIYENAVESYKKAKKIFPKMTIYRVGLIHSYELMGNKKKTEDEYLEAIEFDAKNADYQNDLGNAFYSKDDFIRAEKCYNRAIMIDPNIAQYHANRGIILSKLYKLDEAITEYKNAVNLLPNNAGYWNILGNLYYQKRDFKGSVEYYEEAIKIDKGIAVYYANLGGAFRELKDWKKAIESFKKAIDIEYDNADFRNALGVVYHRSEEFEKAIECYTEAIKFNPNIAIYHANLVLAHSSLKHKQEAEIVYQEAIRINPKNADYQVELGNAFYMNELFNEAIECYKRAIKIEPNNAGYRNELGVMYHRRKDYTKAIACYIEAIKNNPKIAIYRANLINAYVSSRNLEMAEKETQIAASVEKDNPSYQHELGTAFYQNGDYERAAKQYLRAIALNPDPTLINDFILGCEQLADLNQAKSLLKHAHELVPNNSEIKLAIEKKIERHATVIN